MMMETRFCRRQKSRFRAWFHLKITPRIDTDGGKSPAQFFLPGLPTRTLGHPVTAPHPPMTSTVSHIYAKTHPGTVARLGGPGTSLRPRRGGSVVLFGRQTGKN